MKRNGQRHTIFGSIPVGVFHIGLEGKIARATKAAADSMGLSVKNIVGRVLYDLLHPEDASWLSADNEKILKSGKPKLRVVEKYHSLTGTTRWIESDKIPYYDDKGNIAGLVIYNTDITEQKRTEEALITSQLQWLAAMDLAHIVYWEFDPTTRTYIFNDPFYSFYGTTAEEQGGYRMTRDEYANRFIYPEDIPSFYKMVNENSTQKGREFFNGLEHRIIRSNGEVRNIIARSRYVWNDEDEIVRIYGANQDITESKRAEEALKQVQANMIQQEKMASIGQLAAGVAHEINNPMGFLSSNLSTLNKYVDRLREFIDAEDEALSQAGTVYTEHLHETREKLKIDFITKDAKELIKESLDGAARVRRIVQDLKSFSRVDQAECVLVNLNETLETTINIAWHEIKYVATLDREFGDIPQIKCYPQQLNQVFLNLMINAAQAIDGHGTITVRTWNNNEKVFVSVSDTGRGIPAGILPRIFEPFFTTKDVGSGTGLGLSISYGIVKNHGGEIKAHSEVGKGSTFTVSLPLNIEE